MAMPSTATLPVLRTRNTYARVSPAFAAALASTVLVSLIAGPGVTGMLNVDGADTMRVAPPAGMPETVAVLLTPRFATSAGVIVYVVVQVVCAPGARVVA